MKRMIFLLSLVSAVVFSQEARTVQVSERDVVAINARLRFTTVIVLPKEEQILDFVCGDKDLWIVNGTQNFAFVKPSKAASATNLNLITASGNIYSFSLVEGSNAEPDLKVFIVPKEGTLLSSSVNSAPRFVDARVLDDYRAQVVQARKEADEQVRAEKAKFEAETTRFKVETPHTLKFAYTYKDLPGFNVQAMYHDGKFTYIVANPQEVPALYEVKDDKPNLVEFRYENGLYVVNKVLDRGWLKIGKRTLHFELKAS